MKCPKCGFNNYNGIKFCKNCGATLNSNLLTQQHINTNNNFNGYNLQNNQYTQTNSNNMQNPPLMEDYNNLKMYTKKKPILKIVGISLIIISMCLMLFAGVYLYLENRGVFDKDKPSSNKENIVSENKIEEKEPTPTPTKEPTKEPTPTIEITPTPTQDIEVDTFFGRIENIEEYKLVGSSKVGYMVIPYDMNIQKMESNSIKYSTSDNHYHIILSTYNPNNKTLQDKSLDIMEELKNEGREITEISSNGGITSEFEYINIQAVYPNENLYLNGYLLKYTNNESDKYHWIALEYANEISDQYKNLTSKYTVKITENIPEDLYNESDFFQ